MLRLCLILPVLIVASFLQNAEAAPVLRVAFLVDDPDLEALLLAGFGGAETLSRAELPRVAAERLLAGAEGNPELTGADVVLVVEQTEDRGSARLVACPSGATIFALDFPKMPLGETARWIVTRVQPSLGAAADPARPRISLTGLRFVTDSPENRIRERTLNLMLATRLQARGALVLERWRMGDLVFEKHITRDDSPFWKTAGLVDGSLSSPASGGEIQASIRIRDAGGREADGQINADDLEKLADRIAVRILEDRERKGRGGAGAVGQLAKMETEAESFLAEARWMLDHGLPRDAWQAIETAIALGQRTREAEMLRVKAAAMCAYPDSLEIHGFGQDGGYQSDAFSLSELPVRVAAATDAVLLAADYWLAYRTDKHPGGGRLDHPANLGVRTLYTGLRVLRTAHDCSWAAKHPDAVLALRKALQRSSGELLQAKSLRSLRATLCTYLVNYAGYWNDSPAGAIAFYRTILDPDFKSGLRKGLWPETIRGELAYDQRPHPPFLVGDAPKEDFPYGIASWRVIAGDETSAHEVWSAFLDELDQSSDVLNRADGLALRWQSTANKQARLALAVRMVDFVANNPDALSGISGYAILRQFINPLRDINHLANFAPTLEKLAAAYLVWLRPDSGVSPEIIKSTEILLGDLHTVFLKEEQALALLATLDDRYMRPQVSKTESAAIDFARSTILKNFPSLRTKNNTKNTLVASLWMAPEHTPGELSARIGFNNEAVVWQENSLWALDPFHGRLWEIDPASGRTAILSAENRPSADFGSQLVIWGKRLAVTTQTDVRVLDESRRRWTRLELPSANYRITAAHGYLWAASGESSPARRAKQTEGSTLYRIASDLTCELVASSRRRLPVHPLDASLRGSPFAVFPHTNNGVVVGLRDNWTFLDSNSGIPPPRYDNRIQGYPQITSTPGLILRQQHVARDRNRLVSIENMGTDGNDILLAHPERDPSVRTRYPWPEEIEMLPSSASRYVAALRGEGVDILVWSSFGSPWGATEAWLLRVEPGGRAVYPVHFVWPADGDQRVSKFRYDPDTFRYPAPDAKGLIATDQGLVITGRGMAGFWFIPNRELDKLREAVRPANFSAPESIAEKRPPN
ncbi:hypothetical protein OpiT1DRAFT_02481 [Opitutaceae bacterium TAV1]|nr:hypothetical protein OpiT1DRAFT_02481 [Opitutaceae bacterium TAV1]